MTAGANGRNEPRTFEPVTHRVTWKRYPDRIEVTCSCQAWSPALEPHYDDEHLRRLAAMHADEEPVLTQPSWVLAALAACDVGPSATHYEELILKAIRAAEDGIRADERQRCEVRLRHWAAWLESMPDGGTSRDGLRAAADLIGKVVS